MSHFRARLQSCNRAITRARPARVVSIALFALLAMTVLAATARAQSAPRPEALVKWRQSAFQVIGWNTARIKSSLAGTYDANEVRSAANALAAVASAGLVELF